MTVLISLYSSAGVVAFKARSIALASISALVIVVLQNLTVSAMSSSESFSTFSYQDAKNWSSWLPIDGSISILKFQGMILSLMQVVRKSLCDSKRAIFSVWRLSLMACSSLSSSSVVPVVSIVVVKLDSLVEESGSRVSVWWAMVPLASVSSEELLRAVALLANVPIVPLLLVLVRCTSVSSVSVWWASAPLASMPSESVLRLLASLASTSGASVLRALAPLAPRLPVII